MIIRAQQMSAFEESAKSQFEAEMVAHSQEFSPKLCEVLGEAQLLVALRSAMKRAEAYGFTYRGPIRLFIELMFLCGSGFDTDPQYPMIGQVLRAPGDQMDRAQQIHEGVDEYIENVSGPGNANVRRALGELSSLTKKTLPFSSGTFVADILGELKRVFPQKAAYVGDGGLRMLIDEAAAEGRKHDFSTVRQKTLLVVLKFAFGLGCTRDPLYPWIEQTLNDQRITSPDARAKRLERKASTWLDHVLAHQGAQPA